MTNQLVVNVTRFETRIALLENGAVVELYIERKSERGLLGSIFKGRVQRVLPGMQAAFVDLGLDKAAFLYVGDILPPEQHDDDVDNVVEVQLDESPPPKKNRARIEDLLKAGQEIMVQVTKDSIGTKGPRVSCNLSLPGRHFVLMPSLNHLGVSRKIIDEKERDRLRDVMRVYQADVGGFVARTVSQGVEESRLHVDCTFLVSLWRDVQKRAEQLKAPSLVQPELDLVLRCVREMINDNLDRVIIDDAAAFERVRQFVQIFDPLLSSKIELFQKDEPIFDCFGVESDILRAMSRKVWLRSGGYLVIDQAEALTAIDVNTGRFVGRRNLEDTILRTNFEAVREVAYQLRLRNIGGMVIIDFIDMELPEHRDKVLDSLVEALKKDRARSNVVKMSELGLVEMTRQRTRESLEQQLCEPCFYCDGKGTLKSKKTIAYEIFRALHEKAKVLSEPSVVVHAHPEVVDMISGAESDTLASLEASIGKHISVRPRGSFHQEQFDIFGSNPNAPGQG